LRLRLRTDTLAPSALLDFSIDLSIKSKRQAQALALCSKTLDDTQ
jgi:hypothetical protein